MARALDLIEVGFLFADEIGEVDLPVLSLVFEGDVQGGGGIDLTRLHGLEDFFRGDV